MTIGKIIRDLRLERQMTQSSLAERLGISTQTVSKWEQEITAPDISLLGSIAEVFSVSTDELLGVRSFLNQSGYKQYRDRLLAVYEAGGTDEDFRRAASAYESVLLHGNPETADYMMYGYLYNCRGLRDIRTALQYYEKALEYGENHRDWSWFKTHQQITILMNMTGRGEEAVERWKKWLNCEPDNPQAYLAVIWALYYAHRPEEALAYAETAVCRWPEDPSVVYAMGDVLGGENGLKRYAEAIDWWKKARQMDASFGDVYWSVAYALEKLGRYDDAISEYKALIRWLRDRGFSAGVEETEIEERIAALQRKMI